MKFKNKELCKNKGEQSKNAGEYLKYVSRTTGS